MRLPLLVSKTVCRTSELVGSLLLRWQDDVAGLPPRRASKLPGSLQLLIVDLESVAFFGQFFWLALHIHHPGSAARRLLQAPQLRQDPRVVLGLRHADHLHGEVAVVTQDRLIPGV